MNVSRADGTRFGSTVERDWLDLSLHAVFTAWRILSFDSARHQSPVALSGCGSYISESMPCRRTVPRIAGRGLDKRIDLAGVLSPHHGAVSACLHRPPLQSRDGSHPPAPTRYRTSAYSIQPLRASGPTPQVSSRDACCRNWPRSLTGIFLRLTTAALSWIILSRLWTIKLPALVRWLHSVTDSGVGHQERTRPAG